MNLTFDLFSGRANPSWALPPTIARKIFELTADIGLLSRLSWAAFPGRLGYRGVQIVLPQDIVTKYRVSPWLNLSADSFGHAALIKELGSVAQFAGFLGLDDFLRLIQLVIEFLQKMHSRTITKSTGATTGPCAFETLTFDPKPWNDPAFIRVNNCYAYASNKLASYASKPQPGIASGRMFSEPPTGNDVADAAKRDGAHDVADCFPDTEAPRNLVALVIWPGVDYHWYRKHKDCWGHKPGGTPARNVDDSGAVITDPQTCDRGPYTEFTRYMLIPKSQKVAA